MSARRGAAAFLLTRLIFFGSSWLLGMRTYARSTNTLVLIVMPDELRTPDILTTLALLTEIWHTTTGRVISFSHFFPKPEKGNTFRSKSSRGDRIRFSGGASMGPVEIPELAMCLSKLGRCSVWNQVSSENFEGEFMAATVHAHALPLAASNRTTIALTRGIQTALCSHRGPQTCTIPNGDGNSESHNFRAPTAGTPNHGGDLYKLSSGRLNYCEDSKTKARPVTVLVS
ncbi:hypothetical protein SELMODRAFT_404825 [Selaginella moellendorffii]|uniref:Uncharacterized protein n=1 Tax=Selaginella moellendorffii TaxID=88036 RepID=D8QXH4_SELML|nr:hypothetical protein SELMODRAFT_404825 [Selaginella moellendorffii]